MKSAGWLASLAALCLMTSPVMGGHFHFVANQRLKLVNKRLAGTVLAFTRHDFGDYRIWSSALCEKKDMYVYLPPCYDPNKQYPVMLWLHGFVQDERTLVNQFVEPIDDAIRCGKLPPLIVAAPDGTLKGRVALHGGNSFFLNTKAGNFEDYLLCDVWPFLLEHFPIRPEREAHVIGGMSMGGFAAYNQAFKHCDQFKVIVGIFPPLNLRWVDCHCRYLRNFDPCCWGWRTSVDRGCEVVGRFYAGLITIRMKDLIDPLFERGPEAVARISYENPIEMLDRLNVCPGEFEMYVAYSGKDQFNIDAQVESFLHVARCRGLCVDVGYEPKGRHDLDAALKLFPGILEWLAPRIAPYSP